eukprot:gene4898-6901_t
MCMITRTQGRLILATANHVIALVEDELPLILDAIPEDVSSSTNNEPQGPNTTKIARFGIDGTPTALITTNQIAKAFTNNPLIAIATEMKNLYVLQLDNTEATGTQFTLLFERRLDKKATSMLFDMVGNLLISDKFGDVYRLNVMNKAEFIDSEMKPICGHVSMLLDMDLQKEQLRTADRDGKIRISLYPESYVIKTFCLGHLEFVSAISGNS